ncbi:MAG: MOSC domain-containing protein, partial [Tepidisphaeraceae bacterium]
MPATPVLVSIQVGLPQARGVEGAADPMDRPWTSGFVKEPVRGPVRVGATHLEGDGQADLWNHGGVDKAILAYSAEHYPLWREELALPDMPFGAFGENFTIAGLDERTVCVGDVWQVGEVRVEVSQPRQPCWKLARRWRRQDLPQRVLENGRSGWYFRVLDEGNVEAEQTVTLLGRPFPRWTVAKVTDVMMHRQDDREATAELSKVTALAASWRAALA